MIRLETKISVVHGGWVREFCKRVFPDNKCEFSHYDVVEGFAISRYIIVNIDISKELFDEAEVMVKLRSGMSLLDHINLYCRTGPDNWANINEEEEYEYFNT